jgi:hypothetical protein
LLVSKEQKSSAIEALRWFNGKADELESSRFLKTILSEPLSFRVHVDITQNVAKSWRTGPDEESIKAFVITIRQFYMKKDPFSFHEMARHYEKLREAGLIPETLARDFKQARDALERFFDSETSITFYGEPLIRRRIFEVFVFGVLSHTDKRKRPVYDQWKAATPAFPAIEREFIAIMVEFLNVILRVRDLNQRTLEEITP